ncbi:MAG: sigma-70 family RNA polymerase sigma factor [Clostridiales bacterium]|nr:sigma-70 family RNA polymerase sigma factor [Clostridiales bacterium]
MAERPKRRKDKDNPYTLEVCEEKNIYKVYFKDGQGLNRSVDITREVYKALDKFELEDISHLHKVDKYVDGRSIDNTDYTDIILYNLKKCDDKSLEEMVEEKLKNEELYKAINLLSEIQKRRLKLYYFEDLTLQEIADIEGCSVKNVFKSIEQAKNKIAKKLKK